MIANAPALPENGRDDGPVTLVLDDSAARFSLRIAESHRDAASAALGFSLPARIGERATGAGREALRLGPDEWVIHAGKDDAPALEDAFAAVKAPHSLVDVSERERAIVLSGPLAAELLATGCPLNLACLPPGRGTRTVFDGVTVTIRRDSDDSFTLEAWRSYVPHVWQVLAAGNRELATGL